MRTRTYILLFATLCLTAPLRAQEQGQSQGSAQGGAQGASVLPASSSVDGQGIGKYLLGPGDTLDVRVFGQSDLNWSGEIEADGNITSLPFIATPIRAQCRTDKEVQKDIVDAYSKFLRKPQISVRVTGRNSRVPATIYGAVALPTRVQMLRPVRLNEVITLSGGITERSNGDIQVLHMLPVMCPEPGEVVEPSTTDTSLAPSTLTIIKWSDLIAGKPEANPIIRPGDVVTVMESKPVYITGSVVSPQAVLLRDGYTLTRVVAMVGGVASDGISKDVRIYRKRDNQPDEIIRVDIGAVRKKKRDDVLLQAYDIIEVPKESEWSPGGILKGVARTVLGGMLGGPTQTLRNTVVRY